MFYETLQRCTVFKFLPNKYLGIINGPMCITCSTNTDIFIITQHIFPVFRRFLPHCNDLFACRWTFGYILCHRIKWLNDLLHLQLPFIKATMTKATFALSHIFAVPACDLIQVIAHLKNRQPFGLTEFIRVFKYFLIQSIMKGNGNTGKQKTSKRKIKNEKPREKAGLCHRPEFRLLICKFTSSKIQNSGIIFTPIPLI